MRTAYVYVGRESARNFRIGEEQLSWGWEEDVLARASGRAIAASLEPGDLLILGHLGPGSPRVPSGTWATAVLQEVLIMEVVEALFRSQNVLWPDKVYPWRVGLELVEKLEHCGAGQLGASAMEAIRLSGCKQGAPVLADGIEPLVNLIADDSDDERDDESTDLLDAVKAVKVRREQRALRRTKFGFPLPPVLICDLCGRTLPSALVRAAHIKRRSDCNGRERRELDNIMAACTLGCDELFEHGYVYVDERGLVRQGAKSGECSDVQKFAIDLVGRRCMAYCADSERFFAHHRYEIAAAP